MNASCERPQKEEEEKEATVEESEPASRLNMEAVRSPTKAMSPSRTPKTQPLMGHKGQRMSFPPIRDSPTDAGIPAIAPCGGLPHGLDSAYGCGPTPTRQSRRAETE